ncbi:MAG: hypothetical protein IJ422_05600 [Oscillospiraceae bacterium]|nr:hypothetical protein [Oscillospiraceae bacterium]
MVDIHCHILPGVDDGAEDLMDALEMARMAADSGVHAIAATPHCNLPGVRRKNFASQELAEQYHMLREAIRKARIPVELLLGAEVMATPDVVEHLRREELLTLNGSRYLLTEFFFDESFQYMDRMLERIAAHGLVPVVAHPERYGAIQEEPYLVEQWFARGYVIQLNKGSILGRLGARARMAGHWLLEHGLAHAVASDAHSPTVRTTHMEQIRQEILELTGEGYAQILLERNPRRILNDQPPVET